MWLDIIRVAVMTTFSFIVTTISNTFRTPIGSCLSFIVMKWFLNSFYGKRAGHSNEGSLSVPDQRVLHIADSVETVVCVASCFVCRSFGGFM